MKVTNYVYNIDSSGQISVFEYPDCICINGQCFNKNNFEVQPLKFRSTFGNQILTKQVRRFNGISNPSTLKYSLTIHNPEPECTEFIRDDYNPNIFYTTRDVVIDKYTINEKDNLLLLWQGVFHLFNWGAHYECLFKFLDQDKDFIYFIREDYNYRWSQTVTNTENKSCTTALNRLGLYIVKINKLTNNVTYICIDATKIVPEQDKNPNNGNYMQRFNDAYKLYNDSISIYLLVLTSNHYNDGITSEKINEHAQSYYKLYRIDKNTNTAHCLNVINKTGHHQQCRCNPIKIKDNYYFIDYTIVNDSYDYIIREIIVNKREYNASFNAEYNIINHTIPKTTLTYHTNSGQYLILDVPCFSLYKVSDSYIVLITHANGAVECAAGKTFFGIYLIKVSDEVNEFTQVDTQLFYQKTYGVLQIDKYTYAVVLESCVNFYSIDTENNKINLVYQKSGSFYTVSMDERKRLYFFSIKKIEIASRDEIIDAFAEFELEDYNYIGEDIRTRLFYWSKNYYNQYQPGKIRITLSDNCIFENNNSNTIIVDTKNEKDFLVVVIKNAGSVYATTDILEVI